MFYPTVPELRQTQIVTNVFLGYNRNPEIGEGQNNVSPSSSLEFWDMDNLTSDYFPMLANRRKRGIVSQMTAPGGLLAKEELAYVDDGKLYYNGSRVEGLTLTPGPKQLASMGAYLLIWPDKMYLNTKNLTDYGSVDTAVAVKGVVYTVCDGDAKNIENIATQQPKEPSGGQYWLDNTTTPHSLKQFNAATSVWITIPTVYVKLSAKGIGAKFEAYDGVKLSGIAYGGTVAGVKEQYEALNGTKIIHAKGDDYIVVVGMIDEGSTQSSGEVTILRSAPDMDFITEAGNRLWGCKYGIVDGKTINEIYACALGDFKNWNEFQGISTDSYAASVGTDGKWTGAITHLGYPIFFKENALHKVFVSSTGAHQINDTACRGVQEGCGNSLAIVGERLFYKSRSGIMMYDGSLPSLVSDALGNVKYAEAAAGAIDEKYYVSMRDGKENWHLFVLDTERGLWHREDNTHAQWFARAGNELFYIDADTRKLMCVRGSAGSEEATVSWSATTGIIGYTTVEQKYVSRFNLRLQLPKQSRADMYIQYDSDGIWNHCGHMEGVGTKSFMLPVRPRRCDHFQLRIEGEGDVRIYSFAKVFEAGSDVV